jgi:hypothetical protein
MIARSNTVVYDGRSADKANLSLDILSVLLALACIVAVGIRGQIGAQHSCLSRSHGYSSLVRTRRRSLLVLRAMAVCLSSIPSPASSASFVAASGSVTGLFVFFAVSLSVLSSASSAASAPATIVARL